MFEQPESFVSEGVRTLTSDLNRISAAVDSFKTKLRIDLTDLEVEPAVVELNRLRSGSLIIIARQRGTAPRLP